LLLFISDEEMDMSLDLPREIEQLAERRAAEVGLRSAADYVARLVAADACDTADPAIEAALREGLEGEGEEWNLEAIRGECRASLIAARA
jgi:antitoxin ParD1/3/4